MSDGGDSEPREEPARLPRCAICGKPASAHYRPFCSKRCSDIDLARWLNGSYAIAGGNQDADEDGDDAPGTAPRKDDRNADE